jgi:pyruvate ferredoxin oxidoreductase gamma subunit
MIEIRWHGRGGQGAFTAARLLGNAMVIAGKKAQAFPSFGPERRGAPVLAFNRIDDEKITDRSEVVECDSAVVLDDTLFGDAVRNGLKENAVVVINTVKDKSEFDFKGKNIRLYTIDATGLALDILGRDITNVPMLGALAAASDIAGIDILKQAIDEQLAPKIREKNKTLLEEAYKVVKEGN